jgi:hypothetical protein
LKLWIPWRALCIDQELPKAPRSAVPEKSSHGFHTGVPDAADLPCVADLQLCPGVADLVAAQHESQPWPSSAAGLQVGKDMQQPRKKSTLISLTFAKVGFSSMNSKIRQNILSKKNQAKHIPQLLKPFILPPGPVISGFEDGFVFFFIYFG